LCGPQEHPLCHVPFVLSLSKHGRDSPNAGI
jgi:hypothetical protein